MNISTEEIALLAAKADGWTEDTSPGTEMSNDRWYRRCPTKPPVREEDLINKYREELDNLPDWVTPFLANKVQKSGAAAEWHERQAAANEKRRANAREIIADEIGELTKHAAAISEELERYRRHLREKIYVDATPDSGLPARILSAHIDESEYVSNPDTIGILMNDWQRERNKILRQALSDLTEVSTLREENERLKREVEEARSAMRARDNIGMSREEYHKAKKALEENETLRVHLASERQAKIERGDMFIELQAQYAAAQEWQNGVWGALRVALPDYDEIKEPAHEAIARLANYLDTSQKESLCFRKEISALWSRVASAEKARDEARAAVESSRSRFAELIALAYMPAADPSAKLHSRTWKDECAAHSKHADALAGIARDFRAQLTALRQWSEQAREAMRGAIIQMEYEAAMMKAGGFRTDSIEQAISRVRALLAARSAQGMEGRG